MYVFAAIALFVSLAGSGLLAAAEEAEIGRVRISANSDGSNWDGVHAAALQAGKEGRREELMKLLLDSWDVAATPEQQTLTSEEIGLALHRKGSNSEAKEWLEDRGPFA